MHVPRMFLVGVMCFTSIFCINSYANTAVAVGFTCPNETPVKSEPVFSRPVGPESTTNSLQTVQEKIPPDILAAVWQNEEVIESYRCLLIARLEQETKYLRLSEDTTLMKLKLDQEKANFKMVDTANTHRLVVIRLAHLMVAIGIGFSFWEMYQANRVRKHSLTPQANDIAISLQGVALKTSINGLAFLVIALGFYYLIVGAFFPPAT